MIVGESVLFMDKKRSSSHRAKSTTSSLGLSNCVMCYVHLCVYAAALFIAKSSSTAPRGIIHIPSTVCTCLLQHVVWIPTNSNELQCKAASSVLYLESQQYSVLIETHAAGKKHLSNAWHIAK